MEEHDQNFFSCVSRQIGPPTLSLRTDAPLPRVQIRSGATAAESNQNEVVNMLDYSFQLNL